MSVLQRLVWRLRGPVYRLGFRPRPGSIFYSPSAALIYSIIDAGRK
ncbi:hypothetical protein SEA_TFORTROY_28 [Arthrobacter phage TforTroy]|uniref:Uncharacterized protein n=1 Tax=Arthrobacter phage TforTroy TaxID=3118973 RepID=A0ABZ2CPV7_9CAUD